jgi:C1A family cysteine protease
MTFKDAFKFLRHNCVELKNGCEKTIERYAKVNSELQLKQALVMNGPCVGGLPVYDTYKSNFWKKEKEEKVQGLHAVAIVGYTKEGFIIRNSWGRFYGDGGYAILPYDDFKNFTEIWTII